MAALFAFYNIAVVAIMERLKFAVHDLENCVYTNLLRNTGDQILHWEIHFRNEETQKMADMIHLL